MTSSHLAHDFRNTPYWWDSAGTEFEAQSGDSSGTLPERAEVAIIGGGYTGLSAALTLARAGRDVVLLDAEMPGYGCSSRNGGLVGPSFHKLGLTGLVARHGIRKAHAILSESMDALKFLYAFIEAENIDCGLQRTGRFRGADRPGHYEDLAKEIEGLKPAVGLEADMVSRHEQHAEIGSDAYYGGAIYHQDGHLHPGRYVAGLIERVRAAGVQIVGNAAVTGMRQDSGQQVLAIGNRQLVSRQVLVATNGYTPRALPYFRRRVIPLRSAIITTAPLKQDLMRELSPKGRGFGGTSRLVLYYRPSPDGTRMVFGGRTFHQDDRPAAYTNDLYDRMTQIFPQLNGVKITHGWSGTVAYTFDHAPHIGNHEGVFYAMGYCGSGVGRATWFGRKVALKMIGDPEGKTSLDDLVFETRPFYTGTPWFLPFIIRWHAFWDGR
jgi:glycine/D-amino acid oxidase-like deaminating enzyme